MKVTRENFPHLHRAFELISHDRGSQAGHAWYEVPDTYMSMLLLSQVNHALGQVPEEDFEEFCIGEQLNKMAILARHGSVWLSYADELLTEFFESDWPAAMTGMMNDTCDFSWKEMADGQLRVMPYASGSPLTCPRCLGKYRARVRERWKQMQAHWVRQLPALDLRARVPECLNAPTVYVPPPTKKERSMSRFEMWKDYNEAQGIAGYSSGGRRR